MQQLVTEIVFLGQKAVVACDRKCEKAFGVNRRPRIQLSEEADNYAFLADDAVGLAPQDPGTYEGGEGKPYSPERHNKWCVRECERSVTVKAGEPIVLPNFSEQLFNQPEKHQ